VVELIRQLIILGLLLGILGGIGELEISPLTLVELKNNSNFQSGRSVRASTVVIQYTFIYEL